MLTAAPQIGYYHIVGADPAVIHGTEFEPFGNVYAGAWSRITNALATAYKYNIGVLIGAFSSLSPLFPLSPLQCRPPRRPG